MKNFSVDIENPFACPQIRPWGMRAVDTTKKRTGRLHKK